mmetsp:Transcript_9780/g.23891  ORF Transcript_9780/g.23891 Transcript_9780/m.23891 type:complete len:83 (+) Transcript_9780:813-1061(+)
MLCDVRTAINNGSNYIALVAVCTKISNLVATITINLESYKEERFDSAVRFENDMWKMCRLRNIKLREVAEHSFGRILATWFS